MKTINILSILMLTSFFITSNLSAMTISDYQEEAQQSQLHRAVCTGDIARVKELIANPKIITKEMIRIAIEKAYKLVALHLMLNCEKNVLDELENGTLAKLSVLEAIKETLACFKNKKNGEISDKDLMVEYKKQEEKEYKDHSFYSDKIKKGTFVATSLEKDILLFIAK